MGTRTGFWLKWSLRDLRRRWLLVGAISLVLSIGIGMFAALGSTATWRRDSNDASFAAVAFHDLRAELPAGETVGRGELLGAVSALSADGTVTAAEERLLSPTQVEAVGDSGTVLVRGEIVGVDVSDGGPDVDRVHVTEGTGFAAGGVGLVEPRFAEEYGLDPSGRLVLAGGAAVGYDGFGVGPEDFLVRGDEAGLLGYRNWAVVYLPLEIAGEVTGRPGQVNDLVVTVDPEVDPAGVAEDLADAISRATGLDVEVTDRRDAFAYRTLYDDIDNDQKVWNVMAGLILGGAAFAAFNLVSRVVEAQRREIGVGMALGVTPGRLAIRPLAVGAQVGVIGVALGVGVGLGIGRAMQSLLQSVVPLPVWTFRFQWDEYLFAAGLGVVIPLLAAAIPVWRAVRVEPVDAITTVHARRRTGLLGRIGRRVRLPGRSLVQIPVRNLLRTPRRAVFTALAVGATITTLVAVLGMLDSLFTTLDRVEDEGLQGAPDRVDVRLDGFVAEDAAVIGQVTGAEGVAAGSAALELPAAAVVDGRDPVELLVRFVDLDDGVWRPTLSEVAPGGGADGIVLSSKAVADLGLGVGDEVVLRHPVLGGGGVRLETTPVSIDARHPDPIRAYAYMDLSRAELFGADGLRNLVMVEPVDEDAVATISRALFEVDGVVSTTSIRSVNEAFADAVGEFTGILRIMEGGVLALALLIAYNASSISTEERAREHATMFAFGVPVRSVTWINVAESAVMGLFGTLLGFAVGYGVLTWIVEVLLDDTFPELGMVVDIAPATVAVALGLGVAVVAVAPVLAVRRLVRMEIADTLRVME